ncbi:hypothetical protein GCM10022226_46740 [Sphaerisporangium flaviroseum]|uniref:Uncharacterized protein n=1 Tax=Sphaerisporangium flaviroseum TaxID=509199 RepID=A0ABP7IKU6_9ACTN
MIANAADTVKFASVPGEYTRICVGDAPAEWAAYRDAYALTAGPAAQCPSSPAPWAFPFPESRWCCSTW